MSGQSQRFEHFLTQPQPHNVGRAFQSIAQSFPNFPAIVSKQALITYGSLFSVTVSFAQQMQARGVGHGSVVAVNTGDTLASLACLFATSLLGSGFVVASEIVARQKTVMPTHFFKTAEAAGKAGVPFVDIDESWMPKDLVDPAASLTDFHGYFSADDPWMYMFTSGTTGNPKTVGLSQRAVFDRTMAVSEDYPLARTTMASLFGNTSRPFYARALATLLNAGTIVDGLDIVFWDKAGVNLVVGSPHQFEEFLISERSNRAIERVEVGGGKVSDDMARLLAKAFRKVTISYGACETSQSFMTLVSVSTDGTVKRSGRPLDSTVQIVDDDGQLCAQGVQGMVRVCNTYMAKGYLKSPSATEKSFRDGWFYSGDIACWSDDGDLQIIGRADDVLSFGGLKLNAELIDLILKLTPGVQDAICFKNPKKDAKNEIVAFVVFEPLTDQSKCVQMIRDNYQRQLNLPCFLGNIHGIDQIPRTPEGKLMRARCQAMVLERAEGLRDPFVAPPPVRNIAEALQIKANLHPDRPAIVAEDLVVTYGNLWRGVERFAAKMQACGVGRSSVVGIDTTDMVVSVASIFALSWLGAAYCLIDRDFAANQPSGLTHCFRSPERSGMPGVDYIEMDASWSPKAPLDVSPEIVRPGFADANARCWILGSSGTTGRPKYVSIDPETVWSRVAVVMSEFRTAQTKLFLIFGCNTRPFGIRAVAALLGGHTIVDSHDLDFLLTQGVNFVCASPRQVEGWLAGRTLDQKLPWLQVSGAKLDAALTRRLLESFEVVEDVYGSSETIVAHVTTHRYVQGHIETTGRSVASTVEVVDDQGQSVPQGQQGLVRIRNAHMARGYDDLPEESAKRFRNGWFYPGDLAQWGSNNVLQVLGRSDDVINLGGLKLNLTDVDAALMSSPLVAMASAFADPLANEKTQICACVQTRLGVTAKEAAAAAWNACAQKFGHLNAPHMILTVPDIALTQDGMPRRRTAQAQFVQALAQQNQSALNATLFRFEAGQNDL